MDVKVYEILDTVEVVCSHPEDNSRYYKFGVSADVNWANEEEVNDYIAEAERQITEKVNPYGYWHEVEIRFIG